MKRRPPRIQAGQRQHIKELQAQIGKLKAEVAELTAQLAENDHRRRDRYSIEFRPYLFEGYAVPDVYPWRVFDTPPPFTNTNFEISTVQTKSFYLTTEDGIQLHGDISLVVLELSKKVLLNFSRIRHAR